MDNSGEYVNLAMAEDPLWFAEERILRREKDMNVFVFIIVGVGCGVFAHGCYQKMRHWSKIHEYFGNLSEIEITETTIADYLLAIDEELVRRYAVRLRCGCSTWRSACGDYVEEQRQRRDEGFALAFQLGFGHIVEKRIRAGLPNVSEE